MNALPLALLYPLEPIITVLPSDDIEESTPKYPLSLNELGKILCSVILELDQLIGSVITSLLELPAALNDPSFNKTRPENPTLIYIL